jgi:protoporphyrinogen oxidase
MLCSEEHLAEGERTMIVILGGGLAGLAAAERLARRKPGEPRLILEREADPGGLCRSRRVGEFTFDYTGHYLHLRDPETMTFVQPLMGDRLALVQRRSFVHTRGVRLDFPFQANLHGLPADVVARCVLDFIAADCQAPTAQDGRTPFDAWARRVFGDGIAEGFLLPYNAKVFGVAPREITAEWALWSAPRPDVAQVVRGALGLKNTGLGYNPNFRYPKRGGIEALVRALAERVKNDLRLRAEVVSVDVRARTVTVADGETLRWNQLISTLPLPALLSCITRASDAVPASLGGIAAGLRWRAVIDLQLGIDRPGVAEGAHWIYFPDADAPFYRVGLPSNVCPALAPAGCSSVSVEFSHPSGTPVPSTDELLGAARPALERGGVLRPTDQIIVADSVLLDPAYVIFDDRRTPLVAEALAWLADVGIQSIGRFGSWTYSYMERALIEGRVAADRAAAEVA